MSAITVPTHAHAAHGGHAMTVGEFISTYVFSLDHKIIGLQFLFSTLLWFLVGGLLALGIRWQLAWPWSDMPVIGRMLFSAEGGQISPEFYTAIRALPVARLVVLLVLAVVHDPGHRWVGAGGDLDQVEVLGVRVLERFGRRLDPDLRAVRVDQPDARDADRLVDPGRVLLRPGLLEPAPRPH